MAAPAKAPGNWEQTLSLAVGTRETQHRHGYQQEPLSKPFRNLYYLWKLGSIPQRPASLCSPALPVVASLNRPPIQLKSKRARLHSTHA